MNMRCRDCQKVLPPFAAPGSPRRLLRYFCDPCMTKSLSPALQAGIPMLARPAVNVSRKENPTPSNVRLGTPQNVPRKTFSELEQPKNGHNVRFSSPEWERNAIGKTPERNGDS